MNSKLDKLLKNKVVLRRKKYNIITALHTKTQYYFLAYNSINSLKITILREKAVNGAILKEIRRMHKRHMDFMPTMEDLHQHSLKLSFILDDEYKILKQVSLLRASSKNISILVSKDKTKSFLKENMQKLAKSFEKEEETNKKFIENINSNTEKLAARIPGFLEKQQEFSEIKSLIKALATTYKQFLYELNPAKAKEEAKRIFTIIERLQKTELYGYMKSDFIAIQKAVIRILKNPKKNKLASVLAGAYIIAPGTFELTFAALMARYSYKYATRKLQSKKFFKKAS